MIRESLRVAIQRNPVAGSRPTETTHLLAREAQARGHRVWCYLPSDLRWDAGRVAARAQTITYGDGASGWTMGASEDLDLGEVDIVLTRQDAPVNMAWITTTWLLDLLPPTTLVVNPPRALRDTPDKLMPLALPDLVPPTMITADPSQIRAFRALHGDLVLKPLFEQAGKGIFFLDRDDPNFDVVLESWLPAQGAPVVVQRYQPEAREGCIRVLVVDGEPCAAMRSVPRPGVRRVNMDRAARVEAVTLTEAQSSCAARVCALLAQRGIVLAAVDLVGDWLLEVNVGSPGGGAYFDRIYEDRLAPRVWNAIERAQRRLHRVERTAVTPEQVPHLVSP